MSYYSPNQIKEARNSDILEYMISKGETFQRQGNYYRHTEHSSWVYDSRRKVMFFNKEIDQPAVNNCIILAMKLYDFSFEEAIGDILGSEVKVLSEADYQVKENEPLNYQRDIKEQSNFSEVFSYLTKEREIDPTIVTLFNQANLIGEDRYQNIIFKFFDRTQIMNPTVVGVELRGTRYLPEEKRLIKDRPYFLFQHPGNQKDAMFFASLNSKIPTGELKVFEAPIEVMSYLSLYKERYFGAKKVLINTDFCAMSGLKHQVVESYFRKVLEYNRKMAEGKKTIVPRISLCVNNDEAGRDFVDRFKKYLAQKGYSETFINYNVRQELPVSQLGKSESFDYNDLLKETNHLKTIDRSMMVQEDNLMERSISAKEDNVVERSIVTEKDNVVEQSMIVKEDNVMEQA
ncbi:DUF3991 and TOPRIM domain-containing protein [Enterococcus hirae]